MNFAAALAILTLGTITLFGSIAYNIKEQHALMQQGIESYVESQQSVKLADNTKPENFRRPAIIAGDVNTRK